LYGTGTLHNTALNGSDNLPSLPPDNHHSSDDVYQRGGVQMIMIIEQLIIVVNKLEISSDLLSHYNGPCNLQSRNI